MGNSQKKLIDPPTYDPTPKFSGKERDQESGLDYFGARYFYHPATMGLGPLNLRSPGLAGMRASHAWDAF
jgi:hypothetical protein